MKTKKLLKTWLLLAACIALVYQQVYSVPPSPLEYIDNGIIKLGINTAWGGGIGYFSRMGADVKNVINRADPGRNVQQSFYGDLDGSFFGKDALGNDVPWWYNPVQGGDKMGNGSLITGKTNWGDAVYVRTNPKKWSWDNVDSNDKMEQWIMLRGDVAQIVYRYKYNGNIDHRTRNQEMPAPYFIYELANLAFYSGAFFYRTGTDIPNLYEKQDVQHLWTGEYWAAYVNAAAPTGWGCGILSPHTNYIEYHRSYDPSASNSETGYNTNYFSPIKNLPLTIGYTVQYTAYMNIGNLSDIRNRFVNIRNNRLDLALNGSFETGTTNPNNWVKATDEGGSHTYYKSGGTYAYDGTDSVALTAESNGSTWILPYWKQVQNGVTGGTAYKIKFRAKCEQLYNGIAGIRIIQFNRFGGFLNDSGIIAASIVSGNDSSFQYKEFNFTTLSNTATIEIRLQLNSQDDWSRVWFDAVKFSLKNI